MANHRQTTIWANMFSTFSNSRKNTPQKRDGKGIDMVRCFSEFGFGWRLKPSWLQGLWGQTSSKIDGFITNIYTHRIHGRGKSAHN